MQGARVCLLSDLPIYWSRLERKLHVWYLMRFTRVIIKLLWLFMFPFTAMGVVIERDNSLAVFTNEDAKRADS